MKKILLLSLLLTCSMMNPARSYGVEGQISNNDLNNPSQGSDNPEGFNFSDSDSFNSNRSTHYSDSESGYSTGSEESDPSASDAVNEFVTINGEKYPTNSETLMLSNNKITKIDDLKSLVNLKKLNLKGNQITDIGPLGNLTKLESLNLKGNQITDIGPLGNLENLEELYLRDNKIKAIPLIKAKSLEKLTKLNLSYNDLTSKNRQLSKLKTLEYLDLSHNKIEDISDLTDLKKLKFLDLSGNPIPNDANSQRVIQTLRKNNPNITIYGVDHIEGPNKNPEIVDQALVLEQQNQTTNNVTIGDKEYPTNSILLNLELKWIKNISPLKNLGNLEVLNLEDNYITSIEDLKHLQKLDFLNLSDNKIESIEGLQHLKKLKRLNLWGNQIKSIEGLQHLKKLEFLYLWDNPIPNDEKTQRVIQTLRKNNPNIKIFGPDSMKAPETTKSWWPSWMPSF
jgi:internalin A